MSIPQRTVRSAFALVALTWMLLVFGSTVRVHGAGLACPDWPLCFDDSLDRSCPDRTVLTILRSM